MSASIYKKQNDLICKALCRTGDQLGGPPSLLERREKRPPPLVPHQMRDIVLGLARVVGELRGQLEGDVDPRGRGEEGRRRVSNGALNAKRVCGRGKGLDGVCGFYDSDLQWGLTRDNFRRGRESVQIVSTCVCSSWLFFLFFFPKTIETSLPLLPPHPQPSPPPKTTVKSKIN